MSLGAMTLKDEAGVQPSAPTFHDRVQFAGDGAYPTGGTASFTTLFQALTKTGRKPIAVIGQDCGGYTPVYDEANDKLKVYTNGLASNPQAEVANAANLGAVTFNVIVVSQ